MLKNLIAAIVLCSIISCSKVAIAQESADWWNKIHGWETGMPSWKAWMKISPGFLGPNALPIPNQVKGTISDKKEFEISADFHTMKGDNAQNLTIRYFHPFADNRIAVELWGIPIEHYAMDTFIRNERVVRDFDGKGFLVGDFYFSTLISLVKDRKFPDLVFRMACKTASGNLEAARYTDTPAYWFDLSLGKTYQLSKKGYSLRAFGTLGFYCWQRTNDELLQNDAYLWGVGYELSTPKLLFENSAQGYDGYLNIRDSPITIKGVLKTNSMKNQVKIEIQQGFVDYKYFSTKIAYVFRF